MNVRCLGCKREFATEEVRVLGQTFAAERYCDVCREGEKAVAADRASKAQWERVRVPSAYDDCTFETFEPVPDTANALAVCRQWAKELRAGTDLRQGLSPAWQPRRRQNASRGRCAP